MTIQDYFKHFDIIFNTDISNNMDINKYPMLNLAFSNLCEYFCSLSKENKKNTNNLSKISIEFENSLNETQKAKFEEYEEARTISVKELSNQMFIFGYSLAYQELKEMNALK